MENTENVQDWTQLAKVMKSLKPAVLPVPPSRKRTIKEAVGIFADFPDWEEFLEAIHEKRCAENTRSEDEMSQQEENEQIK